MAFSFIFGVLGAYFVYYSNLEASLSLFDHYVLNTYYLGFSLLVAAILSFLVPVVVPPKRVFAPKSFRLFCPNCNVRLHYSNGSFKCPECGYVIDADPVLISMRDLASIVDLALAGCRGVCAVASRTGECEALRRYADLVHGSLPLNCPYLEKRQIKEKKV